MSFSLTVIKRDGTRQPVCFDKITNRIERIATKHRLTNVCHTTVAQRTIAGVTDGIKTSELDELASRVAVGMIPQHPDDYSALAAAIAISNTHKMLDLKTGRLSPTYPQRLKRILDTGNITQKNYDIITANLDFIVKTIDYDRDYIFTYHGYSHMMKSIVLRSDNSREILETPQECFMRVAMVVANGDLEFAARHYYYTSLGYCTAATPTLLNAGIGNMSSCFLGSLDDGSTEEIMQLLANCGIITGMSGGLGIALSKVPAIGTRLADGTIASGLCSLIANFEGVVKWAQRGGAKRRGGLAVWVEPWHAEIIPFLKIKRNKDGKNEKGEDEVRARSIFTGLYSCDLFMKRLDEDADWSLFCPYVSPGLDDVWGAEFEELYTRYEREGRAHTVVKAREIWAHFQNSALETGVPYIDHKDTINRTNMHIGIIRCPNLCTEVVQPSGKDEIAVCNLTSISLKKFITDARTFDYELFAKVADHLVCFLDRVIDHTTYPVESARRSNLRHRPMGIGCQGLADLLIELEIPYEPANAASLTIENYPALKLQTEIYETLYVATIKATNRLAEEKGVHPSWEQSPASRGVLHHNHYPGAYTSGRYDFSQLGRKRRNIQLTAQMPTAGTSTILGNNESFEPYIANIFTHQTINGEYIVANGLSKYLTKRGLWTPAVAQAIIAAGGSIKNIPGLPKEAYEIFKTAWECKMSTAIRFAAARQPFIEQSQSFNIYLPEVRKDHLTTAHFMAWRAGLKTGCYYLRTQRAIKMGTIQDAKKKEEEFVCSLNGSCGS